MITFSIFPHYFYFDTAHLSNTRTALNIILTNVSYFNKYIILPSLFLFSFSNHKTHRPIEPKSQLLDTPPIGKTNCNPPDCGVPTTSSYDRDSTTCGMHHMYHGKRKIPADTLGGQCEWFCYNVSLGILFCA